MHAMIGTVQFVRRWLAEFPVAGMFLLAISAAGFLAGLKLLLRSLPLYYNFGFRPDPFLASADAFYFALHWMAALALVCWLPRIRSVNLVSLLIIAGFAFWTLVHGEFELRGRITGSDVLSLVLLPALLAVAAGSLRSLRPKSFGDLRFGQRVAVFAFPAPAFLLVVTVETLNALQPGLHPDAAPPPAAVGVSHVAWVNTLNGPEDFDLFRVVAAEDGTLYVAGRTYPPLQPPSLVIKRFAADGREIASVQMDGLPVGVSGFVVSKDALYIAGRFRTQMQLGTILLTTLQQDSAFVARLDRDLSVKWALTLDGAGFPSVGWDERLDELVVGGVFFRTLAWPGDPRSELCSRMPAARLRSGSKGALFVGRLRADGTAESLFVLGCALEGAVLATAEDGSAWLATNFDTPLVLGTTLVSTTSKPFDDLASDVALVRVDRNGNSTGNEAALGIDDQYVSDLALTGRGSPVIVGYASLQLDAGQGPVPQSEDAIAFVISYDRKNAWARELAPTEHYAYAVIDVDPISGDVVVAVTRDYRSRSSGGFGMEDRNNSFVVLYDEGGNEKWRRLLASSGVIGIRDVAFVADGVVIVGGYFGELDLGDGNPHTAHGYPNARSTEIDGFVLKLPRD